MTMPKVLNFGFITVPQTNLTTGETVMDIRQRDIRMADVFARALDVDYEIVKAMDGDYGAKLPNGSFTGLMGLVQREEVDVVISDIALTEDRLTLFNVTHVYIVDGITFVTRKPQFAPKFLTILLPFSFRVWLSLLMCFVAMCAVFYALSRKQFSLQKVILKAFGSLLNQGPVFESTTFNRRLVLFFWSAGTMFLSLSYSAVLLSFMTLPIREPGIRTISDLSKAIEQKQIHIAIFKGTEFPDRLAQSKERRLSIIGEELKRNYYPLEKMKELLFDRNEKFAYMMARNYVAFLERRSFISEENFFIGQGAAPFKKSFCCPERLNRAVLSIISGGFFQKIQDDVTFMTFLESFKPEERYEKEHDPVLTLIDVSGAFSFLIAGYLLSICVFFFELIGSKSKRADR